MPKTKVQEIIFAVLMCIFMVLAMELYNIALHAGGMSNACWLPALLEMRFMLPICFVMSFFFMDPLAQKLAFSQVTPGVDNPILVILVRSGITVALMCPTMSLWATILFTGFTPEFFSVWLQTMAFNFPMALCWQIFFCGPLVRKLFRTLFRAQLQAEAAVPVQAE